MNALIDQLTKLAFHRAPAAEANQAIEQARNVCSMKGVEEAVSYEVALPALAPDDYLTGKVLPKLVYFLDCRGVKVPASGGVFVSVFSEAGLLFLDAGPMVELLAKARGLTLAEVVRRYGSEGKGDPALLGL